MKRKDNIKKMDPDARQCKKAGRALLQSFVWDGSKEGHKYWSKIRNRLFEIAEKDKGGTK